MTAIPIRIVIDRSLELLPAIQEIIRDPGTDIQIRLSDRAGLMSAGYAEIIVLAGDLDEKATLDRIWAICQAKHYPKVLVVASGNAGRLCEDAIVQGASGVIDHSASASVILKALGCLARGELWLDRQRTGRVFDRLSRGMTGKINCDGRVAGS